MVVFGMDTPVIVENYQKLIMNFGEKKSVKIWEETVVIFLS